MSDRKQDVLQTLVVVGRACRANTTQFTVSGLELDILNTALENLQVLINEINDDLVELRPVEIPEADVEAISENLTD